MDVRSLAAPVAGLVVLNVVIAIAPMLVFAPRLAATKREADLAWGAVLAAHGALVDRRWIRHEPVPDDALLSAPELGPVADTNALYETVRGMRPLPVARSSLVVPALATLLPMIPVFATQIPLAQIAKKLLTGLVGI